MSIIDAARAVLAHILEGDDHAAPPVAQVEGDLHHVTAGLATAQTIWGGVVYAVVGVRKQSRDDDVPAARRDALIDKRKIIGSVAVGLLGPLAIGLTLGVWAMVAWAAAWTVVMLAFAAWALKARGLAT